MRWWVVAAGVLALASCSDGDGETAVAEAGTAPPAAAESAPSPTVTTASAPAPPTEPPATSTSTTTTSPSTVAPTTTVDPAVELAAQVEADFREARQLELRASHDPTNANLVRSALDRRTGANRSSLDRYFGRLVHNNQAIRENPSVDASSTIEVAAHAIGGAADLVQLQECEIDPWVVVEVGGAPGGGDAIVDDNVYAYRKIVYLRLTDGTWKIEGGRSLGEWVGVSKCPAGS